MSHQDESNFGPSLADVHGDLLLATYDGDGRYIYVIEGDHIYAVGAFGKARVYIELEMVPE